MTPLVTRLQPGNGHPGSFASTSSVLIVPAQMRRTASGPGVPMLEHVSEIEIPN